MTELGKPEGTDVCEPRLSLCMIVRNESFFLNRCLSSVSDYVDEMVIVDTGSSDDTVEIARRYTDSIYHFDWVDDFSVARNFALERATGDWILVLDADELIAEADLVKLRAVIRDSDHDAYFLDQLNYTDDSLTKDWVPVKSPSEYSGRYQGYRVNPIGRLFRNGRNIHYQGAVHEIIDHSLSTLSYTRLDIPIHHHIDDDPNKRKRDRQLNYLRMMEKSLAEAPSGRLAASAGAVCMRQLNDFARAADYFQQAIELGYAVDQSRENLAEAQYRAGHYDDARAGYQSLYEEGQRSFSLCTNLANLWVREKRYPQAIELLREALKLGARDQQLVAKLQHNIRYLEGRIEQP